MTSRTVAILLGLIWLPLVAYVMFRAALGAIAPYILLPAIPAVAPGSGLPVPPPAGANVQGALPNAPQINNSAIARRALSVGSRIRFPRGRRPTVRCPSRRAGRWSSSSNATR